MRRRHWAACTLLVLSCSAQASEAWQLGAVLNAISASRALELGAQDAGLQLGHSDLAASGPLGRHLHAQVNAVAATHEGKLERGFEQAWLETRTLPGGWSVRAGRFASQIGAFNQQHPHADDFAERPLMYRAFLGGHWNDDGVRVNFTLPTRWYWVIGGEAFRGQRLVPHAEQAPAGAGVHALTTRMGGDLSRSHSWQIGLTALNNRRTPEAEEAHVPGHDDAHAHGSHGARFAGRRVTWLDATWKWAPNGNNRDQQLRLTFEATRIQAVRPEASAQVRHDAQSLAAVWRFHPNWETGARVDRLRVAMAHDGDFEPGRLSEHTVMLAWKPSHLQTLRVQWARQGDAIGFEAPARQSIMLQYVLVFGAHAAHSY
jgi:hypothetical protein